MVFVFCGGPIPPTPFPTRKGGADAVPHFLSGRGARGVGLTPNNEPHQLLIDRLEVKRINDVAPGAKNYTKYCSVTVGSPSYQCSDNLHIVIFIRYRVDWCTAVTSLGNIDR